MQSYDLIMLLVLAAATAWGYWKGFVWQLASLASICSSYGAAYALRAPVARLIDVEPPWNTFAAMLIVYLFTSAGIWMASTLFTAALDGLKLRDFDRQVGAAFGAFKGMALCLIVTFFAVTLLGSRQTEQICGSYSGRTIAKLLRHSGGLIPSELHTVLDPVLTPFQATLEAQRASESPAETPFATVAAEAAEVWAGYQSGSYDPAVPAWQPEAYPPPQYEPRYDPRSYSPPPAYAPPSYDPRFEPRYADRGYDPRYDGYPPVEYAAPRDEDPRYAAPASPDPRYAVPDPRYLPSPPQPYFSPPQVPEPRYYQR